ncbi:hypothetical protein BG011_008824 [Mortierella polycephala]|uniref:Ras-GEF domain-containing protein n=1 Tax=Mortierella polycephala TaxID=41804 RepID=A0A9P6QDW0_9FUNG|nr:hypothetical protein BG011_008824 [Mortierella polycephala]
MLTEQLQAAAAAAAAAASNMSGTTLSTSQPMSSIKEESTLTEEPAAIKEHVIIKEHTEKDEIKEDETPIVEEESIVEEEFTCTTTSTSTSTTPTTPTTPSTSASSRQTSASSVTPSSPAIYSPLLRAASIGHSPRPTRRLPPSPQPESLIVSQSELDSIQTAHHAIQNSINSSVPGDVVFDCLDHITQLTDEPHAISSSTDDEPASVSKPPLLPKPLHLYSKIDEPRTSEDLTLDEEYSEEDDDEETDQVEDQRPLLQLRRKTSSPNIAIPATRRRPGTSVSVPASPSHSPPYIPSSLSSSHGMNSFTEAHYSPHRLNSVNTLISVIPEGCVDPTSLVEAERIHGDGEKLPGLKTYSPSDHLPCIPISPLKTSNWSLVEKEESWAAMVEETKQKLQMMSIPSPTQKESNSERRPEDERDYYTLQEDLHKYKLQINNVVATIVKVRELIYRSASTTSILEFPPYLIAYQLTLVESAIFLEIPNSALLSHSPKTPHKNITASTDFFNYLTRTIEYSILFPPDASGRAQCMNHWVKVAVKLHELENFQTLKAVLCALGTPPIKRLKRTWSFMPRKSANKLETLWELMSETRNYGKYREMINSLCTGTIIPSPETTSPVLSDAASSISASRFDILGGSWTNSDIKVAKEATRRPMVPFLGTFIMDMTYLLAAVKSNNHHGSSTPSRSAQIPATSSLRERSLSVSTSFSPADDVRVQDLLLTLTAYQSGPRYSPQPPRSFIKASIKSQNHFRAPSLSSALQITTKYRNSAAAAMDRDRSLLSYDDDEDEMYGGIAGSGGIRSSQQLILHYLLTRPWVPERMVDELSMIREPSKNSRSSSSGSSTGSISSRSGMSTSSSIYSQSSDPRSSHGSSEYSRPTSMEESSPGGG